MTYPDFPLECTLRSDDDRVRAELARAVLRDGVALVDDTEYLIASDGVRVLGRNEEALRRAVAVLEDAVPGKASVSCPSVRHVDGARRLEPYMHVATHAPASTLPLLQRDLDRRGARILRLDHRIGTVQIEAEAPLARLLGYGDWLAACTEGRARMRMSLSRYRPVESRRRHEPAPVRGAGAPHPSDATPLRL